MPARLSVWLLATLAAGLVGAGYSAVVGGRPPIGFATGVAIGGGITAFELFLVQQSAGASLRRAPLATFLAITTLAWLAYITLCLHLVPTLIVGGAYGQHYDRSSFGQDLTFSFAVCLLFNAALRVRALVGPRVLVNFLAGRYHKPVREERIFMFLDLADSTALAERLGDLRTQALIARFFFDIAAPVARHGGETHRYIGDEVVVTWPMRPGPGDPRCLRCVLAIATRTRALAQSYHAEFGHVPRYRIGLHGGPVVASEVGDDKREIVYFGDVVNTAARIGAACKTLDSTCLVSAELLARLAVPPALASRSLGPQHLRGKQEPVELCSIETAPAAPVAATLAAEVDPGALRATDRRAGQSHGAADSPQA